MKITLELLGQFLLDFFNKSILKAMETHLGVPWAISNTPLLKSMQNDIGAPWVVSFRFPWQIPMKLHGSHIVARWAISLRFFF